MAKKGLDTTILESYTTGPDGIVDAINTYIVPLIFTIALIVFLFGVARKYVFSHGDPTKVAEGHKLIMWGIIGFVVMLSVWGLVNILQEIFGLTGGVKPDPPTI